MIEKEVEKGIEKEVEKEREGGFRDGIASESTPYRIAIGTGTGTTSGISSSSEGMTSFHL